MFDKMQNTLPIEQEDFNRMTEGIIYCESTSGGKYMLD